MYLLCWHSNPNRPPRLHPNLQQLQPTLPVSHWANQKIFVSFLALMSRRCCFFFSFDSSDEINTRFVKAHGIIHSLPSPSIWAYGQ